MISAVTVFQNKQSAVSVSVSFLIFLSFSVYPAAKCRHPELMYTIAALLVVVYIGTLEVGIPELNDFNNR